MGDVVFNLGPFNDCCEYLGQRTIAEYPVDFYDRECGKMRYYSSKLECSYLEGIDTFVVPTFSLCFMSDDVQDSSRAGVVRKVELKILEMIYGLAAADVVIDPHKVVIPIKSAEIVEVDGVFRVTAEVGIAIFAS